MTDREKILIGLRCSVDTRSVRCGECPYFGRVGDCAAMIAEDVRRYMDEHDKHGQWTCETNDHDTAYKCSSCGRVVHANFAPNFCSSCGSKNDRVVFAEVQNDEGR